MNRHAPQNCRSYLQLFNAAHSKMPNLFAEMSAKDTGCIVNVDSRIQSYKDPMIFLKISAPCDARHFAPFFVLLRHFGSVERDFLV